MTIFEKYKKNLKTDDNYIYSYNTKVALIDHKNRTIYKLGYWSMTTSKHINYVGKEYNYNITNMGGK